MKWNEEYYKIAQDRLNGISQVERREKELGIQNIFDFLEGVRKWEKMII